MNKDAYEPGGVLWLDQSPGDLQQVLIEMESERRRDKLQRLMAFLKCELGREAGSELGAHCSSATDLQPVREAKP